MAEPALNIGDLPVVGSSWNHKKGYFSVYVTHVFETPRGVFIGYFNYDNCSNTFAAFRHSLHGPDAVRKDWFDSNYMQCSSAERFLNAMTMDPVEPATLEPDFYDANGERIVTVLPTTL